MRAGAVSSSSQYPLKSVAIALPAVFAEGTFSGGLLRPAVSFATANLLNETGEAEDRKRERERAVNLRYIPANLHLYRRRIFIQIQGMQN